MPLINRTTKIQHLTIANGAAVSDAVNMTDYAGGQILMPAAWTAASIGFQIASSEGSTYYPFYASDATIVEIASPAASKAYQIPIEVFGCHWIKLWSQDGAGSDTNQGAARTVTIQLKS